MNNVIQSLRKLIVGDQEEVELLPGGRTKGPVYSNESNYIEMFDDNENDEDEDEDDCSSESDADARQTFVRVLTTFIQNETGRPPQHVNDLQISMYFIDVKHNASADAVRNWWIPANHPVAILMQKRTYRYRDCAYQRKIDAGRHGCSLVYSDDVMRYTVERMCALFKQEGIELEYPGEEEEEEEAEGTVFEIKTE
jgi:hypothetical protein